MKRWIAFPFLVLSEPAVQADPWLISLNDDEFVEAGDFLESWDSASTIRLRRFLNVDLDKASAQLQIPSDHLALVASVRVGTGAGSLPRLIVGMHHEALAIPDGKICFEFAVPNDQLSLVLDLFTDIVLARIPAEGDLLAPSQIGDRVWYERRQIRLEGTEPRFPIEVVQLDAMLRGKTAGDALWYLDWSTDDWHRDFHGAVRLFLNDKHPDFVELVEGQDRRTLQSILADAMSQVCERFVMEEDAVGLRRTVEEGTLGKQAGYWLSLAWPRKAVNDVRSLLKYQPGEFRAAFLAVAELEERD